MGSIGYGEAAMVRGVIFDLDGTLLDTLDDITAVVNAVLPRMGRRSCTRDEVRLAVGSGVEVLSRRLLPPGTGEVEVLAAAERIRHAYLERGSLLTRPYEGIEELLVHLTSRGTPLAVLSNKPQLSAEEAVSEFFPSIPFRIVRGVIPGRPIKPHPGSVLDVLDALGTAPGETALIGDSEVDMITAGAAGLLAVGVAWGFRDPLLLLTHGATSIAGTASEIPGLLFDPVRIPGLPAPPADGGRVR